MTKPLFATLAGLLLLTGCAHGYVLTMSNGDRVHTGSKPKLVNGFYYYKDASGRPAPPVFAGRVTEIAPASMASDTSKPQFKAAPPR
jgi:hypothetical protein